MALLPRTYSTYTSASEEYDNVDTVVYNLENGINTFVTGGGGVGKSYLLQKVKDRLNDLQITSSTGVSAVNIGGQTLHSWLGIGIGQLPIEAAVARLKKNKPKYKMVKNTRYLAIDEISMIDNYVFNYADLYLKEVRENNEPFGGLTLLILGDFFQLPPVLLNDKETPRTYAFNSVAWKSLGLHVINLTKVYRQNDIQFITALNNIRLGKPTDEDIELLSSRNVQEPPENAIRLYACNNEVEKYNNEQYSKLHSQEVIYQAIDVYHSSTKNKSTKLIGSNKEDDKLTAYEQFIYNKFLELTNTKQQVRLKPGCRVMLLQNTNVDIGLVNGACGIVLECKKRSCTVKFDNDVTYTFEMTDFEYYHDGVKRVTRTQIPLILAYACTIHKSQGMSLDCVFVDFTRVFANGQSYVALSRAKSLDGLYLRNFDKSKIKVDFEVCNFYNKI